MHDKCTIAEMLVYRDSIRKAREAFLIPRVDTIYPDGLNAREEMC